LDIDGDMKWLKIIVGCYKKAHETLAKIGFWGKPGEKISRKGVMARKFRRPLKLEFWG